MIPRSGSRIFRSRAEVLGWEPKVEIREGIRRTLPFFEQELACREARARTI